MVYLQQHHELKNEGLKVSSTHIRQALANANFDLTARLLGRPYTMSGRVAHGNRLGQLLGFPTANIHLKYKIIPLKGVYAAKIHGTSFGALKGIVNIGTRPTIDVGSKNNILEAHILDFNKDIYGEKLTIEFLYKIRQERKFDSIELLRQQIIEDVKQARFFFGHSRLQDKL